MGAMVEDIITSSRTLLPLKDIPLILLCPLPVILPPPGVLKLMIQVERVYWLSIAVDQITPKLSSLKQQTIIISHRF